MESAQGLFEQQLDRGISPTILLCGRGAHEYYLGTSDEDEVLRFSN